MTWADVRGVVLLVLLVIVVSVGLTAVSVHQFESECNTSGGHFSITATVANCHYGTTR